MREYYDERTQTESVQKEYVGSGAANEFLRQVYIVMGLGLFITGMTAWFVAENFGPALFQGPIKWLIFLAPLAFVFYFSARFHKMSYTTTNIVFASYAFVNGISFSVIFMYYDLGTIAQTFFVTAGTFGTMALIGMTTKIDLTKMGSILYMALIGLIIASVVNLFLASSLMDWIISFAGVLIFSGLTAYDTQKLMRIGAHADLQNENTKKATVAGALSLYLDFINLFLFLLRFMGGGRD